MQKKKEKKKKKKRRKEEKKKREQREPESQPRLRPHSLQHLRLAAGLRHDCGRRAKGWGREGEPGCEPSQLVDLWWNTKLRWFGISPVVQNQEPFCEPHLLCWAHDL